MAVQDSQSELCRRGCYSFPGGVEGFDSWSHFSSGALGGPSDRRQLGQLVGFSARPHKIISTTGISESTNSQHQPSREVQLPLDRPQLHNPHPHIQRCLPLSSQRRTRHSSSPTTALVLLYGKYFAPLELFSPPANDIAPRRDDGIPGDSWEFDS